MGNDFLEIAKQRDKKLLDLVLKSEYVKNFYSKENYLYKYGEYVSEQEIAVSKYFLLTSFLKSTFCILFWIKFCDYHRIKTN